MKAPNTIEDTSYKAYNKMAYYSEVSESDKSTNVGKVRVHVYNPNGMGKSPSLKAELYADDSTELSRTINFTFTNTYRKPDTSSSTTDDNSSKPSDSSGNAGSGNSDNSDGSGENGGNAKTGAAEAGGISLLALTSLFVFWLNKKSKK